MSVVNKIVPSEIWEEIWEIEEEIKEDKESLNSMKEKKNYKSNCYKKFDKIYYRYGQLIYKTYVPKKYQKMDIKNLLKEQRFLELYNKHGKKVFNKYKIYIKSKDMEYETGNKIKSYFIRIKDYFFKRFLPNATAISLLIPSTVGILSDLMQGAEEAEYSKQIEEYLDDIQEYGKEIKKHNLTDIQNIMKVMDDMWENIDGYGEPKIDLFSYPGLDLADENGIRSL